MKRKQICKKFFGCLLAGTLIMGSLSGCGSQTDVSKEVSESKPKEEVSTSQPEEGEEKVTLTMAWTELAAITAHSADISETALGQAWQEATGVELEIVNIADRAAFNLLFASGELPDILYYNFKNYPGGPQAAISDGIIEPLTDYMEYAPNLQAVLDSNESYRQTVTTGEGDIIGFPWIRDSSTPGALSVNGIAIRQDWLEDLGLNTPQTADEFYEVLKAFKEKKGAEYPLSTYTTTHFITALSSGMITSPFGLVKGDFYQKDGKVHYGFAEQEYRDVLEWLNKMYNEGLIDPNIASMDSATFDANITNGTSGAGFVSCGTPDRLTIAGVQVDPEYDLLGIAPLVTADGKIAMSSQYSYPINGAFCVITPACENKEAAMKFLDYAYSEEGTMLFNFGIEGESYEMVDGVPRETELITNHPEGWTVLEAKAHYHLSWDSGPMIQLYIPESVTERTRLTRSNFSKSTTEEYLMPQLFFDEETSAELSKYMGEINTMVEEKLFKYIMGTESLDTFDNYVKTLYEFGLDKAIAIYQEGLDAYNSR